MCPCSEERRTLTRLCVPAKYLRSRALAFTGSSQQKGGPPALAHSTGRGQGRAHAASVAPQGARVAATQEPGAALWGAKQAALSKASVLLWDRPGLQRHLWPSAGDEVGRAPVVSRVGKVTPGSPTGQIHSKVTTVVVCVRSCQVIAGAPFRGCRKPWVPAQFAAHGGFGATASLGPAPAPGAGVRNVGPTSTSQGHGVPGLGLHAGPPCPLQPQGRSLGSCATGSRLLLASRELVWEDLTLAGAGPALLSPGT